MQVKSGILKCFSNLTRKSTSPSPKYAQEDSIEKAVNLIRSHREVLRKAVQTNKDSIQYKLDHDFTGESSLLDRFLTEFDSTLKKIEWKIMYKVQSLNVDTLLEQVTRN